MSTAGQMKKFMTYEQGKASDSLPQLAHFQRAGEHTAPSRTGP